MIRNLPRKRVLRGHGTFTHILGIGSVLKEGSVKLWYAPSAPLTPPRIGFAVARVAGNAVARNRVKRCLREAVRLHQEQLYSQKIIPFDIVLMYVGPAVKRPGEIRCRELQQQVVSVLRRFIVKVSES